MPRALGALTLSLLALVGLFASGGCERRLPAADERFLRLGGHERADTITVASPREAVRLYLLTIRHVQPFDVRSRDAIARRGKATMESLVLELESATTDLDRWACIVALGRTDELNPGLVSHDSTSQRAVGAALGMMQDGFFRSNSREVFVKLRRR